MCVGVCVCVGVCCVYVCVCVCVCEVHFNSCLTAQQQRILNLMGKLGVGLCHGHVLVTCLQLSEATTA